MPEFRVDIDKLTIESTNLYHYSNTCKRFSEEIAGLNMQCLSESAKQKVEKTLRLLANNLSQSGNHFARLSSGLGDIIDEYRNTENRLSGNSPETIMDESSVENVTIRDRINDFIQMLIKLLLTWAFVNVSTPEINNIVFDDEGSYGSNQGSAKSQSRERQLELWEIVRRNNPNLGNLTPEEINNYYENMNSSGCGYASMANVIFQYYIGREEDFERDFGYPMYYNGDLNYDAMIVDIYSRYSEHNNGSTNPSERKYCIEDMLGQHGISVTVDTKQKLSLDSVKENLISGNQVLVRVHNGNIYTKDKNGNLVVRQPLSTHSMEVTGVTDDGVLIVSSWGKKYYIKPDEVVNNKTLVDYEVVRRN